MIKLVELFCDIDDFCKVFIPQWEKQLLEGGPKNVNKQDTAALGWQCSYPCIEPRT